MQLGKHSPDPSRDSADLRCGVATDAASSIPARCEVRGSLPPPPPWCVPLAGAARRPRHRGDVLHPGAGGVMATARVPARVEI
jgi:hypothetical protein